ncbi:MAG: phenylacetic acid degradation operon negative regulatory protein PaaX, partial [Gammaproteobacteria bacterium]|nr:phenylacetic acid degradation operon negative regulatory protein PaaX [Gammaproteobacteria bacterium]
QATLRIYGDPRQSWDGDWCLALLDGLETVQKESVRKELGWLGFGSISANVLAHPAPDIAEVESTLRRSGAEGQIVIMRGQTIGRKYDEAMRALVHRSWNLEELDRRYAGFVEQFRPVFQAARKARTIDERLACQVRTLLIQEYRRILLRDPLLPAELLPAGWNGTAAYQLCRNLYQIVFEPADAFMSREFETADGPLPPPAPEFYRRFGGLDAKRGTER